MHKLIGGNKQSSLWVPLYENGYIFGVPSDLDYVIFTCLIT
jgi:hypothetical protein